MAFVFWRNTTLQEISYPPEFPTAICVTYLTHKGLQLGGFAGLASGFYYRYKGLRSTHFLNAT